MTKTHAQWRAENPILFISLHLSLGIFIGDFPGVFNFTKYTILLGLVISQSLLIIIPKQNWINNIVVICWGILIGSMSKQGWTLPIDLLKVHALSLTNLFLQKIDYAIVDRAARGFAKGLLLGYKSDIDKSLYNAYKQLGLLHIIAISGMHLEIIFKNLHLRLQALTQNKIVQCIFLLFLLFFVGTYTLMTGASASVVRAALFFCLYALGKFLGAPIYTLNLIAGGILCMLILDWPSMASIGLQLSYGAILGIYIWYNFFYKILVLKNPLLVFLWSNLCMSMAAQMGTLPIIAFHFHQISSIVLISNCIMVPISNLLLYGLVLLMCMPYQLHLVEYLGKVVEKYIIIMNQGILKYANTMPIGQAEIFMDKWDLGYYFLGMFWLYQWLQGLKNGYFLCLLSTLSLWIIKKLFS
jgi:competence protein ComEC